MKPVGSSIPSQETSRKANAVPEKKLVIRYGYTFTKTVTDKRTPEDIQKLNPLKRFFIKNFTDQKVVTYERGDTTHIPVQRQYEIAYASSDSEESTSSGSTSTSDLSSEESEVSTRSKGKSRVLVGESSSSEKSSESSPAQNTPSSKGRRYEPKSKESLAEFFKNHKSDFRTVNGHDYWIDHSRGSMIVVPRGDDSDIRSILFSNHKGGKLTGSDNLSRASLTYLTSFEKIESEFDTVNEQRISDGKPPLAKSYTVNFSLKWDRAYIGFPDQKDPKRLNKISIKLGDGIWEDIKKIWDTKQTEDRSSLDERGGIHSYKKKHQDEPELDGQNQPHDLETEKTHSNSESSDGSPLLTRRGSENPLSQRNIGSLDSPVQPKRPFIEIVEDEKSSSESEYFSVNSADNSDSAYATAEAYSEPESPLSDDRDV